MISGLWVMSLCMTRCSIWHPLSLSASCLLGHVPECVHERYEPSLDQKCISCSSYVYCSLYSLDFDMGCLFPRPRFTMCSLRRPPSQT